MSDEIGERTHDENEVPTQGEPVSLGPPEDPCEADHEEPQYRARSRSRGR